MENFMREFERQMEEEFRWLTDRAPKELVRERVTKHGVTKEFGPFVYGYSVTIGPDGRPVVREFGNVRPGALRGGPRFELRGEREPLVDVIDEEKQVRVVAEIPGVRKEDIDLTVDQQMMTIRVNTEQRKYFKEVELPAAVEAESTRAAYNNGVLEVTLQKKGEPTRRGQKIRVD